MMTLHAGGMDGCPWRELALTVDAPGGASAAAAPAAASSLRLTVVPIPQSYQNTNQPITKWPQLPHAATRPRATACRWGAGQVLQLSQEFGPHCAFSAQGPFMSDRKAWDNLLNSLRAGSGGDNTDGVSSSAANAVATGGARQTAAGRAAKPPLPAGRQQRNGVAAQQQQQQPQPLSPPPPQQQQQADESLPFDSVLVMRIAGLHIDSHIKLLLVPSQPLDGGPAILLGYLLLFTWLPHSPTDPSVSTSCGLTAEEARRCLVGSARANASAWSACLARQPLLSPLSGLPLAESKVESKVPMAVCTPEGRFDYVMHSLERVTSSTERRGSVGGSGRGGGAIGAAAGGGSVRRSSNSGRGSGNSPGRGSNASGGGAAAAPRAPAGAESCYWGLRPLLGGGVDAELERQMLQPCSCVEGMCRGLDMRRQLLNVWRNGVQFKLLIRDAGDGTGLGVFALEGIPAGSLLSDYVGEVTLLGESEAREARHYNDAGLLYTWSLGTTDDADEEEEGPEGSSGGNTWIMDATFAGNFTRFINHSCEPNVESDNTCLGDARVPFTIPVLTTLRDIDPGEQLTIDYCPAARELVKRRVAAMEATAPKSARAAASAAALAAAAAAGTLSASEGHVDCRCGQPTCRGKIFLYVKGQRGKLHIKASRKPAKRGRRGSRGGRGGGRGGGGGRGIGGRGVGTNTSNGEAGGDSDASRGPAEEESDAPSGPGAAAAAGAGERLQRGDSSGVGRSEEQNGSTEEREQRGAEEEQEKDAPRAPTPRAQQKRKQRSPGQQPDTRNGAPGAAAATATPPSSGKRTRRGSGGSPR